MSQYSNNGYDFETAVSRSHMGNMKEEMASDIMKSRGIVSFGGAEMDFPTAPSVIDAIVRRAKNGLLGYTIVDASYLEPIVFWMRRMRNTEISPQWIVPVLGTIYSVATAIRLLCRPGEGIITMTPVYYRYEQAARRLGRETFHCPLIEKNGIYTIDFELLERLMAKDECRLLVLCNPHNPVGRVWSRDELTGIARLSARYRVPVFSDEIFAEITFDGHETIPYISIEEGREWAMTATSLGKTFNFTGVNQANVFIPDERLREAFVRQRTADHFGSIDPLFHAAIGGAYCEEGAAWVKALLEHLDKNRTKLMSAFGPSGACDGRISPVEGSFVAWIRWQLPKDRSGCLEGEALAEFLRREALLDLEPGLEYGSDCGFYTRMNFATTTKQLLGAIGRIRQCVAGPGQVLGG